MKPLKPFLGLLLGISTALQAVPLQSTINNARHYGFTTYAGNGGSGLVDGSSINAEFWTPVGVAVDRVGNVFVADQFNCAIRKISTNGVVSTYAGNGTSGFVDGTGTNAEFDFPSGVAVDAAGNVFVADWKVIRKISTNGVVTTYAGNGTFGFVDGSGTNVEFAAPAGVAVDAVGNVFVSDAGNNTIRKIATNSVVTTVAENGTPGFVDGSGTNREIGGGEVSVGPGALAVDAKGNVYVADPGYHVICKIATNGVVTTLALDRSDGSNTNAFFSGPDGVAVDAKGNLFVTALGHNTIRKIAANGVVTTVAGNGAPGLVDGSGADAEFYGPLGVAVDSMGNLFVADQGNQVIRKGSLALNQQINFPAIVSKVYLGPSFALIAHATSGLPVSYTSTSDNISIGSNNVVSILGAGTATITASQSGDDIYNAAASVSQNLVIQPAAQSIKLTNFPTTLMVENLTSIYASSTSGQTVKFTSSNTNVVSTFESELNANKVGTAIITITAPATANFKKATLLKILKVIPTVKVP